MLGKIYKLKLKLQYNLCISYLDYITIQRNLNYISLTPTHAY